jgi:hypothetical protein
MQRENPVLIRFPVRGAASEGLLDGRRDGRASSGDQQPCFTFRKSAHEHQCGLSFTSAPHAQIGALGSE